MEYKAAAVLDEYSQGLLEQSMTNWKEESQRKEKAMTPKVHISTFPQYCLTADCYAAGDGLGWYGSETHYQSFGRFHGALQSSIFDGLVYQVDLGASFKEGKHAVATTVDATIFGVVANLATDCQRSYRFIIY
ncbi:uncharacterized protein TRIADDRAFT_59275 [Trichoplax adhaerens]|uniref:Uncharacterized protein n=1 Tax=Trichoplax adhaerens TaxID=10228 RepID=B3S5C2_TRIAD|nr:predicted protein [Trichoplax adhaerens]EDV22237.1 predicted protein [Trichoplax adhaerens]|eukprot:XP_002115392.1 predicted protein [Trichoplax adhaerens]